MIWIPCHAIVVGATTIKRYNQHPLWTIFDFMDSDEKDIDEANQTEAINEHGIQILKSRARNILPSVHSAVAAASPLFSSYRSVFQNWKHSMPKLYKYPSSDIEVVVYRKNGDVERLPHYKRDELKEYKKGDTDTNSNEQERKSDMTVDSVDSRGNEVTHFFKPSETVALETATSINTIELTRQQQQNNGSFSDYKDDNEDNNQSDKLLTLELKRVPLENTVLHPLIYPTQSQSLALNDDIEFPGISKCNNDNSGVDTHGEVCKFIYNFNTRLSLVPSLERRKRKNSKDSWTQTSETIHIETDPEEINKHIPSQLQMVTYQNAEIQCTLNAVEHVSNYSQTNEEEHHVDVVDVFNTLPVNSDAETQTDELWFPKSTHTQTYVNDNSLLEAVQFQQLHTVEWHGNVPCCNMSNQTDFFPRIPDVQETACQAVSETVSKYAQVENDISTKMETSTLKDFETRDIGVQVSANCCYFASRKERKHFECKLNAIRKEIASFYKPLQNCMTQNDAAGGINSDQSILDPHKKCSNSLSSSLTVDSSKVLEEAKRYLDELGSEVEDLRGNTLLLKSNLESLEGTSYFEDDWLQSNI